MSAPRQEALELVREALTAQPKPIAELRAATGLGHDDLIATLDSLRLEGEAFESEVPGEWASTPEGPEHSEPEPEPARAPGPAPSQEQLAAAEASRPAGLREAQGAGEVVLTMAIAGALDAETIGKLVEAGIAEAKAEDRAFVLRVEP